MKILLSLLVCCLSLNAFTQDKANKKDAPIDKDIPQYGTEVIPERQQDTNTIENPFQIGPYKEGNYQFTNPDRDPDAVEEPVGGPS